MNVPTEIKKPVPRISRQDRYNSVTENIEQMTADLYSAMFQYTLNEMTDGGERAYEAAYMVAERRSVLNAEREEATYLLEGMIFYRNESKIRAQIRDLRAGWAQWDKALQEDHEARVKHHKPLYKARLAEDMAA